ncbi:RbsU/GlcU family sugar/proton symporter [Eikenella sp. S3360]|uniref:RbsU/GlcU family sugar/proton symporter n=1 Tax=Eikenella glucosivorans TaxID=2766967 RepID=A0ABS0NBR0_9NEIS|nr:GRP family sugar transporter [Eikenella glucosivorans]MBH5329697.1 RbsU/GlcU family sugar/proton symporter [Eikenella glucosivorans]
MNILIGLLPALFWGLLPLCVSKIGGRPSQQIMGTTIGVLLTAIAASIFFLPVSDSAWAWLMCFLSGAFWAFGQMNQYRAFTQIGVSKTMPLSTGMQLAGTSLMGVLVFGEWGSAQQKIIGAVALALIIVGIWMTTKQENPQPDAGGNMKAGIITLLVSTVGYVGYSFFPNFTDIPGQEKFLPQALGMAVSAVLLSRFEKDGSRPWDKKVLQNLIGGVIFSGAALTYLISIEPARNGVATGFTLSQMNVVIATLGSIFLLGEKKTPKEMRFVLIGLALVVIGGIMIGTNTPPTP